MKISVNWMQGLAGEAKIMPRGIDELVQKIGAQLGAVEEVVNLGERYKGIVIAKVVSCEKHPNADKLHVCKIDDGGKAKNVQRDKGGYVQVVCGAPNVRATLQVAWIPPGVAVPSTTGEAEPFVLGTRDLRGVKSNGMIASAHELAISDDHNGILEIDEKAKPGDDFAKLFGLDDYVIDIENKMFTHRPDLFGQLGVAREIAGITHQKFHSPSVYKKSKNQVKKSNLPLIVKNELPKLVPRFMAQVFENVSIKPSPVRMQTYLSRVGIRPINNIVDITNYFMMQTAQPLHAYDYDKVKKLSGAEPVIVVRKPKKGEKIKLLGGKEIQPWGEAVMIATDKKLIGIGGVMGGQDTEVDENTKNVILECANFDMYSIRKTAMEHGLFTDAVTRFNKGQSPLQCDRVLAWAADEIASQTGAVPGLVHDARGSIKPPAMVRVSAKFINERLGLALAPTDMEELLANVEFEIERPDNKDELKITPPFWRTDIEIPEDIVEEVGRLYGYDHLPLELPKKTLKPTRRDPVLDLKASVRDTLSKAGASEVLTYSFVRGDLLEKVGQDKKHAFELSNALSPDLQYYRLSLMPSLLDKVHLNIKAGYSQFALFELNKVHFKGEMDTDDPKVPNEDNHVALVTSYDDKQQPAGAAYFEARNYLKQIAPEWIDRLIPLEQHDLSDDEWGRQMVAAYESKRSAAIVKDGLIWGVVGEFKANVCRQLKLPSFTSGFEIGLDVLSSADSRYLPLSRFPKVQQDITLKVPANIGFGEIFEFMQKNFNAPENTQAAWEPIDIYQGDDKKHKNITLRLNITSYEKTMTDPEVNKLLDEVAKKAKTKFGASRV